MAGSKALGHTDESGTKFAQEMLAGDMTAAINFDRLQWHPRWGYIIFEYLRCGEDQPNVTPLTSHPNKYWDKNKRKFLSLWRAARALNAVLFLVNYAAAGEKHEDEILVIRVLEMDDSGIKLEKKKAYTRAEFSELFRKLNRECLRDE